MDKRTQDFIDKQHNMSDADLIDLCDKSISKMCETGGRSFTMTVPPRIEDTDMLLSELVRRYKDISSKFVYSRTVEERFPQGYHHLGCGVQCASKVSGIPAKKVREYFSDNFPGNREIVSFLKSNGISAMEPKRPRLFPGYKYIAVVPSLNIVGGYHYVVLWIRTRKDGSFIETHVWDPVKNGNRYVSSKKKDLKPNEINILSWAEVIRVGDGPNT